MGNFRALLLATAAVIAAGCGGGGSPDVVPEETVSAGSMSVKGREIQQNLLVNDTTVHSLTGSLTNATYHDLDPTLAETEIYYSARSVTAGPWSIYAIATDGSGKRRLTDANAAPLKIQVNPAGTYVYFRTTELKLWRVPVSGGLPALVLADVYDFAISPNGSIVFRKNTHDGWWRAGAVGGSPVLITGSTAYTRIIGFARTSTMRLSNASNPVGMAEIDLNSGQQVDFATTLNTYVDEADIAQPGLPIWGYYYEGGWGLFKARTLNLGAAYCELRSTAYSEYGFHRMIASSPDGSSAVLSVYAPNNFAVCVTNGFGLARIAAEAEIYGVDWGPFIATRTFVGAGDFSAGAGAVLFSENGNLLPSVVIADAVTRTSCLVTPVSSPGDKNTVFKLTCDNLKKLYYSNTVNHTLKPIVTAATGIRGAYISFTASTGKIASITTFKTPPAASRTPEGIVLEGGDIVEHVTPMQTVVSPAGPIRL